MRTHALCILLALLLTGCIPAPSAMKPSQPVAPLVYEFCFPSRALRAEKITTTPLQFLESHPNATAAINGVYWGADDGEPQGIVYLGSHFTSGKGLVSGYLVVKGDGVVHAGEALAMRVQEILDHKRTGDDYVIGTHPLLVVNGAVHEQAVSARYNVTDAGEAKESQRSALGSTTGLNLCFAVSATSMTMNDWADALVARGYQSAINLDGGPVSQLAVRDNGTIARYGPGVVETRLILFTTD